MNCKPGDLALVVRSISNPESVGKIVRCVRSFIGRGVITGEFIESWITDPHIAKSHGIADANLRPIRDQPGEDEILRIAGKPQDIKETA